MATPGPDISPLVGSSEEAPPPRADAAGASEDGARLRPAKARRSRALAPATPSASEPARDESAANAAESPDDAPASGRGRARSAVQPSAATTPRRKGRASRAEIAAANVPSQVADAPATEEAPAPPSEPTEPQPRRSRSRATAKSTAAADPAGTDVATTPAVLAATAPLETADAIPPATALSERPASAAVPDELATVAAERTTSIPVVLAKTPAASSEPGPAGEVPPEPTTVPTTARVTSYRSVPAGEVPPEPTTVPSADDGAPAQLERIVLTDLSIGELEGLVTEMGQPPFRARQVFTWLYRDLTFDIEQMRTLPKSFRSALGARAVALPLTLTAEQRTADGLTIKALCELARGGRVETVVMLYDALGRDRGRRTICVSTQIGCAVGCPFCATGQSGFGRNLSAGEIVGQVLAVAQRYGRERQEQVGRVQPVTNIVFMGQGEPFLNFEATWKAIELLNSPYGFNLGARRMTVSTAGVIPGIVELARRPLQVNLAVSLHAPNDELRNVLVPINRRYPLADLLAACRAYVAATGRRITFEYVMIDGLNDSPALASELADLVDGLLCHVNLIPLNPTSLFGYPGSPMSAIEAFQQVLVDRGIPTTVRVERGQDIDAACGQLRATVEERAREAARRRLEQSGLPVAPTPGVHELPKAAAGRTERRTGSVEAGPPAPTRSPRGPARRGSERPTWPDDEEQPRHPPMPRPGSSMARRPGAGRTGGERPAVQRPWQPPTERPWQPQGERPTGARPSGPRHDWRERRPAPGGRPGGTTAGRGYGGGRPPSNQRPPGRPVSRLDSRYRQRDERWGTSQPGGAGPRAGERRTPSDRGWRPAGPGGRGEMPPRPTDGHRPVEGDRGAERQRQWRPPGPRPGRRPPHRST